DVITLGDQVGRAPEVEVRERRTEPLHEIAHILATTARRMQRILEQHVGGGEFIDDLGIPGISPEPLEPTADNSLVVLFARHGIDPPLWLKASPPSNRAVSTSGSAAVISGSCALIRRFSAAVSSSP